MVTIDNNAQPVADRTYDEPTVGLIVPPPEIRSIVEKTAQFVARNGENFEHKILPRFKITPLQNRLVFVQFGKIAIAIKPIEKGPSVFNFLPFVNNF